MIKRIMGFLFLSLVCEIPMISHGMATEHHSSMTDSATVTITGIVKFEKRTTRVAANLCGRSPCAHPQVYWSLVIDTGNDRYLFNRKFAVGRAETPEVVELLGVTLRPGSIVKLQGEVYSSLSNPNFFILSQVKGLDLVMDLRDFEGTVIEPFPYVQ
jgi:hypothetical protein